MCTAIENRSANFTAASIKNDALREYANILADDAMNIRQNLLHMSAIMAAIAARRDEGILNEFDNSIVTFGEKRLGLKKSQVYNMVAVGATFLDEKGNSRLTERGAKWTSTQFIALLPMAGTGKNKRTAEDTLAACKKLVTDKKIKPSMTVAEIKAVVDAERPDAAKRAKAAEKRTKKQEAKEQAEETIKAKTETSKNLIGSIEFYQDSNGNVFVAIDGEFREFDNKNVENVAKLMRAAENFKK